MLIENTTSAPRPAPPFSPAYVRMRACSFSKPPALGEAGPGSHGLLPCFSLLRLARAAARLHSPHLGLDWAAARIRSGRGPALLASQGLSRLIALCSFSPLNLPAEAATLALTVDRLHSPCPGRAQASLWPKLALHGFTTTALYGKASASLILTDSAGPAPALY